MNEVRPDYYRKLPDGVRCRCINLWAEVDGSHWCCNVNRRPQPALAEGCCSATRPCTHQKTNPTSICDDCIAAQKSQELAWMRREYRHGGEDLS